MDSPIGVTARERRVKIQARAAAMGIDQAFVSRLVETFYQRIRQHDLLGPIFEQVIGDRWDMHLARMKAFWASVAYNAGQYSGKPVPAHQKLTQVEEWHFEVWLELFRQTLEDIAPSVEVVSYFMIRAERIAESLRLAMFGHLEIPSR